MKYISTRGNHERINAAEAIRLGMVPAGGLFIPEEIPNFNWQEIVDMKDASYQKIAYQVLKKFLTDYTEDELWEVINAAYNKDNFSAPEIAPLTKLSDNTYILELWHGPTAAFKDMALQLMPYLLVKAIEKGNIDREIVILVATSGDTGKAALEGFKDVPGIEIIVFYPNDGVSKIQEAQMLTTGGDNTSVIAVNGNFDDCQNAVKEVFGDQKFNHLINQNGYQFSSANSINWGRLVPQIIYYFAVYACLLRDKEIEAGEEINISVPTGNFGNILSGYYAYKMGLPVNKFICASNDNKILTDFLNTGVYDINRDFKKTISPSMDILISSNLERFLFEMTGHDAEKINKWYDQLQSEGRFKIDEKTRLKINKIFAGEYAVEKETMETINEIFNEYDYTVDPHTAVGVKAYQKYSKNVNEQISTVIDSTANPYKFGKAVLEALQGNSEKVSFVGEDEFKIIKKLNGITGKDVHRALLNLDQKEVRHDRSCVSSEIRTEIKDVLGLN